MPTGYTAKVQDGSISSVRDYALLCARGMGALISMRDDSFDAPIPEKFEADTADYDEMIKTAQYNLEALPLLSNEECSERARRDYDAEFTRLMTYALNKTEQRDRYQAMIDKVTAWECKSDGLKDFMLSQLRGSIEFDCSTSYDREATLLSGKEWREKQIESALWNLNYGNEQRAKIIQRTNEKNAWLAALRESFRGL